VIEEKPRRWLENLSRGILAVSRYSHWGREEVRKLSSKRLADYLALIPARRNN
jgi:hypothetical protein